MKILRLDLLAFGPFSGESFSLHGGNHGLHIVYGPNEAGKSSSLRALRQWLYGIPHVSNDTFVHTARNLRIGGLLTSAAGEELELIRRKGRNKTLRAPDDVAVIEEARLTQLLGGVDEATFSRRFGIDYDELRKGGQAVVRGGGDLGEILFAAGAGVADLRFVQERLNQEGDELFKSRGSTQRINQALSALQEQRHTIKDTQLSTGEWLKHDKALKLAEQRLADIGTRLLEKRARAARLQRIGKALPLLGRRRQLEEQLAEVTTAPQLPADFSSRRSQVTTQLKSEQQAEREAMQTIEKLEAQIADLDVPIGLLEHRTAVTKLHSDLGGYQKAAKDRPGLVARLDNIEKQAQRILQELGREPDLEQAEHLCVSLADRRRIQSLAVDCKARHDKQVSADKVVRKLRDEIQQIESQLAELPASLDDDELRRVIRNAQRHGDLDEQLAMKSAALRDLEAQAEVDLNKLPLWNRTLEDLERLPVPSLESIDRFANDLTDAHSSQQRLEDSLHELTQQAHRLDQSLERLRLEQDVPTEDDLQQARRQRDACWQLVWQAWSEGLPADDEATLKLISEYASGNDVAQAFANSIAEADTIADRLRREADRVAEKAKLTADRQELERQSNKLQEGLLAATTSLQQVQAQWREQWAAFDIEPLPPREMRSWWNQQQALVAIAETLRTQRSAVNDMAALVQTLCEEMHECLQQFSQPVASKEKTLARALQRCESVAKDIEAVNQQRQSCDKMLQKLRRELPTAEEAADLARSDLESWRKDWANAVTTLGLDGQAEPAEANAVIESVGKLLALLNEVRELQSRIAGIDSDSQEFEQKVSRLLEEIAADLREKPVDQAVADLYDRLEAAGSAHAKSQSWQEQLEKEESKRDKSRLAIEQLQIEIEAMCGQAGCTSPTELPAAEERSKLRCDIERESKSVVDQLNDLAAGMPLVEFTTEAEQFVSDDLQAEVQRLEDEIAELDREQKEVAEEIGSHRNELRRMDGSGRAADAQEQAEHLLARIRTDAEQYARLRLASAVLHRSIERFREANQGPVLDRASELFAELTLGSFAGLRADYDDKGGAVIVGVRAGEGQTIGVEGMSDGTCDQLYLALRLALLESCLNQQEPLPFIVDDILIKFDDDRAIAALKTLVQLSEKTQVIFFTHHEHLLTLARQHLDEQVLFTHTLNDRVAALSGERQMSLYPNTRTSDIPARCASE